MPGVGLMKVGHVLGTRRIQGGVHMLRLNAEVTFTGGGSGRITATAKAVVRNG